MSIAKLARIVEAGEQRELRPIGRVRSPLVDLADAPRQGDEGAPEAELAIDDDYVAGLAGIGVGDELLVLTWLHHTSRDVLSVHPRGDVTDRSRACSRRDRRTVRTRSVCTG